MGATELSVPADLHALVARVGRGEYARTDASAAEAALSELGVGAHCEYFVFARNYCLSNLVPAGDGEALCDVCAPTREVSLGTRFIQEAWQVPKEYICLTSCQGEGCILLSRDTGQVFDFSLRDRERFLQEPLAKWPSFFEFVRQHFGPRGE